MSSPCRAPLPSVAEGTGARAELCVTATVGGTRRRARGSGPRARPRPGTRSRRRRSGRQPTGPSARRHGNSPDGTLSTGHRLAMLNGTVMSTSIQFAHGWPFTASASPTSYSAGSAGTAKVGQISASYSSRSAPERRVDPGLELEPCYEVVLGDLVRVGHELPGVGGEIVGVLLVQLADRRAEDHAEVDARGAVDVLQPPWQCAPRRRPRRRRAAGRRRRACWRPHRRRRCSSRGRG